MDQYDFSINCFGNIFSILMIPKLLNLFCNIDDLNHVFILLIAEKLYSHVDELMGKVSETGIRL